jgi:hypothetical protein
VSGVEDVVEVGSGEGGPAGFDLDADGTPVEEGRLDNRRADASHEIDDSLAGRRVLSEDTSGELGEHLRRVLPAGR